MKTFIQNGDVITVTAPAGGVASGDGVIVGSLFGIAAFTAAEGEAVEIATRGVYILPKEPTAVIAVESSSTFLGPARSPSRASSGTQSAETISWAASNQFTSASRMSRCRAMSVKIGV